MAQTVNLDTHTLVNPSSWLLTLTIIYKIHVLFKIILAIKPIRLSGNFTKGAREVRVVAMNFSTTELHAILVQPPKVHLH